LPELLLGVAEEIDERTRGGPEVADPPRTGKRGRMQEDTAAAGNLGSHARLLRELRRRGTMAIPEAELTGAIIRVRSNRPGDGCEGGRR
jgi:hypothetical protein